MSAGFYRGTTHDQTPYFADKQKKELDETTWPAHFDEPLDLERVHLQVVRPWIGQSVRSLLGYEDDIVTLYCVQLLEKTGMEDGDTVCPKKMTVSLRGFLPEGKALKYVSDLWSLLLQAQSSKHGVPQELVDSKLRDVEEMQTRPQADDSRDHITHPTRSRRFRSRSPPRHAADRHPDAADRHPDAADRHPDGEPIEASEGSRRALNAVPAARPQKRNHATEGSTECRVRRRDVGRSGLRDHLGPHKDVLGDRGYQRNPLFQNRLHALLRI
ncbi:MAG: uncharacterized protein KVP18_005054 [Porospora cf. gigantea A]|uniref:uncharacterized protein n=1 Tax=Porospora cf. gigantea A TaxID=2853593 RepID=UPI00355A4B7E|nr:MAG: hypothetical protein KVP18_005054 [Porospora cf. gigantea A]